MDTQLLKSFQCYICFDYYKLGEHEPLMLKNCGHNICSRSLLKLYDNENKIIKCP